jgi:DNA ligase-associated metallophosphoesterase
MILNIPLTLAGASLHADLSGALWWPEESTLIVADLHLEKGSSFADRRRPQFLPPYDTRATIERIETLLARHAPRRVICLGDSVHDGGASARMDDTDSDRIVRMTESRDWIWIAGNHDPEPPSRWGGTVLREMTIGKIAFRHPTAAVKTRAASVSGRCFASDRRRLLLPAFGAYAGGLDVMDPVIAGLFDIAFGVVMLGRRRLFAFSSANLTARN